MNSKIKKIGMICFLLVFACGVTSQADFAKRLSYQGRLTDSDGVPVADGNYAMTFSICTDSGGSSCPWSEGHAAVPIEDGLFSVVLGGTSSLDSLGFDSTEYWMKVSIGGQDYSPLQRITAAAMALNVPDGVIDSAKVENDTLVADDLNVDVVSSLSDGSTTVTNDGGTIVLTGGTGVTVSGNDTTNTITISADMGNIDHGSLDGLADDDHPQYFNLSQNETVSGRPAFNGGDAGSSPFSVDSAVKVTNLNADYLDGYNYDDFVATSTFIVSSVDGVYNDNGNIDLVAGTGISITPNDGANTITIAANMGAIDHGSLTGLGDDDHSQYMHISNARTVTAQHTFAPTAAQAPFVLGANAQGQLVTGLNADMVDGKHYSDLQSDWDARYVNESGDTMAGILNGGGYKFENIGNADSGDDAMNRNTSDSRYLNVSGDTMAGNITMADNNILDAGNIQVNTIEDGEDTTVQINDDVLVYAADTDIAEISAYGSTQGTGRVYVGQSSTHGGGIMYNGDDTPDVVTTTDHISIFRRTSGADAEVLHWAHNSNTAWFEGDINLKDHNILDANNLQVDSIEDADGGALIEVNDEIDMNSHRIRGLTAPDSTDDAVHAGRTINTNNGISGGGNLTSDLTLSLDTSYSDDIYVNESGDTMEGALSMGGYNLLDAGTVETNILLDDDSTEIDIQDAIVVRGHAGDSKTTSTGASTEESIRLTGSTSDYIISTQDGSGRVQHYWNSTTNSADGNTYLASGEDAGMINWSPPTTDYFDIKYAGDGTAGAAITWTSHFRINQNGNVDLGENLYVGENSGSDDDYVYFDTGGAEYLRWENGNARFRLSDDLYVTGNILDDGTNIADLYVDEAGDTMGGDLSLGEHQLLDVRRLDATDDPDYDKLRVWNSSSYTIGMTNGLTYGGISNEYAMTFTMNNTANRGFLWRDADDAVNDAAMSLTTDGRLRVKNWAQVGENLYVGYNSASDDDTLYFDQSSEYLRWENGNARFRLSDDLYVTGNILDDGTNISDIYVNESGDTMTGNLNMTDSGDNINLVNGDITGFDDLTSYTDATVPSIVLDSTGSGDNYTAQAAAISLGESGAGSGDASLHITYTGDGTAHIGMGTLGAVTANIPEYEAIRFTYTTRNMIMYGNINMTDDNITDVNNLEVDNIYDADGGSLIEFQDAIDMNNKNITGVNHMVINDVGTNEGVAWTGAGNWVLSVADAARTADGGYFHIYGTANDVRIWRPVNMNGNRVENIGAPNSTDDAVRADRTISAGTGLSGGGNLTANRTLSVDTTWADDRYVLEAGDTMEGNLDMGAHDLKNAEHIEMRSDSDYDKIRVYPSSSYAIGMHSGMTFGGLNDWAMTFTFNNETDRGFLWRDEADATSDGAMALTTDGRLDVKSNIRAPIYYDSNNTTYYTNPASTSLMNSIDMRGTLYDGGEDYVHINDNVKLDNTGQIYSGGTAYIYSRTYGNSTGAEACATNWLAINCYDTGNVVRRGDNCNTNTGRFICARANYQ